MTRREPELEEKLDEVLIKLGIYLDVVLKDEGEEEVAIVCDQSTLEKPLETLRKLEELTGMKLERITAEVAEDVKGKTVANLIFVLKKKEKKP